MKIEEFDYHLPVELIAQHPTRRRADSRMLVVSRSENQFEDSTFRRLPEFLAPGDVLVTNNSRVLPARLFGHRLGLKSLPIGKRNPKRSEYLSRQIEVLLVRPLDEGVWEALVRPGRKIRTGERLIFEGPERTRVPKDSDKITHMEAEVVGRGEFGLRTLRFSDPASLAKNLQRIGRVPLPPYIRRPDEPSDRLRYQTVYATLPGSVAAPTAGLHFTKAMLAALERRGIQRAEITLHVSLGTFQPIHEAEIEAHRLHPERFLIAPAAAETLNRALAQGRRIAAVGTTTVRALEHVAAQHGGHIEPTSGETQLFIQAGFPFRVVGALLTNFHLPRTTLLMLVAAFAGRDLILSAYEHAVRQRYRFYSYGDCMLIL